MAELYLFSWFSYDFKDKHQNGYVYRQLEYLNAGISGDPVLNIVLRRLATDFRNEYEQRKNKEAVRTGKVASHPTPLLRQCWAI